MKWSRLSRWAVMASAVVALALGMGAVGRGEPASVLPEDRSFGPPQPVEIAGYSGDAMEPFLTRDGRWLLFNTRNGPRDQTDLMLARRIDDRHYAFVGPLAGANSAALDGVPSVDRAGRLFFVSTRDYGRTGNTLWTGHFSDGKASDVRPLQTNFTRKRLLRLNIDLEITADGDELYVAENRWNLFRGRPATSDIAVARRVGDRFERRPDSDRLMRAINGPALDYAPATSTDRLTLYFTRWDPRISRNVPHILVAHRTSVDSPWESPRLLAAASDFVEGATVTPDDCAILYHARIAEQYRLFMVRRARC